ncbi:6751_t:CDS:2 [Racocetra fulgida]|uniref:6751_t:CDS:1 n=1 Tax=Racocetra fulgida TaxID=60492 RepID=A0A9N8WII0_9GLOM|nr:6751_t:CDS:2 [Racocetra fulgida]
MEIPEDLECFFKEIEDRDEEIEYRDEEIEYNDEKMRYSDEEMVESYQIELESESSDEDTADEEPEDVLEKDQIDTDNLIEKLNSYCLCREKCSDKVSSDQLQSLVLESIKMNKKQRRYSMLILIASSDKGPHKKYFQNRYQLPYFGEVQEQQSMLPQLHGNTGRRPDNALPVETLNKVKSFIRLVGEQHGESLAVRKYTRKKVDGQITVQYEKHDLNKIIIRKPSKDVCDECTLFKRTLKESNSTNEDLNDQFATHVNDYQLPHDPQQPGKWYYLSLLKVYQFGLVDEGIDLHWHNLYTEGKALKRANEVTSIIHLFLTSVAVDRGFGNTKREYARSEVWCVDQLVDIINKSANNNISINLEDQIELFRDWTSALGSLYHKPPAIQKYHFFQFSCEKPGIIRAKIRLNDPWDEFSLLKPNVNIGSLSLQKLTEKGLAEEKQLAHLMDPLSQPSNEELGNIMEPPSQPLNKEQGNIMDPPSQSLSEEQGNVMDPFP